MFASKPGLEMLRGGDRPILPTQSIDTTYIDRYMSASEALLRRALSGRPSPAHSPTSSGTASEASS
jgi:hypothetical protein